MDYDVSITNEWNYLRVEVSGQRILGKEVESALEVWKLVATTCKEKNVCKVLAVFDLTGRYPFFSAHSIADSFASAGWENGWKLAFVDLKETSLQNNLHAETVVVNRGVNGKTFDNEKDYFC